jgi:putative flavoprotein involved in K+ transport
MSSVNSVKTVVIGAGPAGLAVSRLLTAADHEHVVLERGRLAERWRSERWDSLHLVTPNWMLRLPGSRYGGQEPDGFTSAGELVAMLEAYAHSFAAPVWSGTTVEEVGVSRQGTARYRVTTDDGVWQARHVVLAAGAQSVPALPGQLTASGVGDAGLLMARDYRRPEQLPAGGVLVVGGSSSGVQIAEELARAGRQVTLALGRHTRLPRSYRGLDIYWWLHATGRLAGPGRDRSSLHENSLQLIGQDHAGRSASAVDLAALQRLGVRLAGRLEDVDQGVVALADDLAARIGAADAAMHRLLDSIDAHVDHAGLGREVWAADRPRPVPVPASTPDRLDLRAEGITTVVAATGYRSDYPWLRLPVRADDGSIMQSRGVTGLPGLYTVGQRFQTRRDSGLIAGIHRDAELVVEHLVAHAGNQPHPWTAA